MDVPNRWREYSCEDYFSSPLAVHGYWHERGQQWLFEPADRVHEDVKAAFLQVGSPGVDGIGFGYRRGLPGLWAYHRIELRFQYLAESVMQLLDGWLANCIEV